MGDERDVEDVASVEEFLVVFVVGVVVVFVAVAVVVLVRVLQTPGHNGRTMARSIQPAGKAEVVPSTVAGKLVSLVSEVEYCKA